MFWTWLSLWGPSSFCALCSAVCAIIYIQAVRSHKAFVVSHIPVPLPPKAEAEQPGSPLSHVAKLPVPDGTGELTVSTPDIDLKIIRHEENGVKGLLMRIINHRLSAIGRNILRVSGARSFDEQHNAYRDGHEFKTFVAISNGPILASCGGDGIWLVRKPPTGDHLLIGNDNQHEVHWPDFDKSAIQRWQVDIGVDVFALPNPTHNQAAQLEPLHTSVTFVWNKERNEFFVEPKELAGKPKPVPSDAPQLIIEYLYEEASPLAAKNLQFSDPNSQITVKNVSTRNAYNVKLLTMQIKGVSCMFDPPIATSIPAGHSENFFARVANAPPLQIKNFPRFLRMSYEDATSTHDDYMSERSFPLTIEYDDGSDTLLSTRCELRYRPLNDRTTTGTIKHELRSRKL